MRTEYLIVGLILVVVGIGLFYAGYERSRPTFADAAAGVIEDITNRPAPSELTRHRVEGYLMMMVGGAVLIGGALAIINARPRPLHV